MTLKISGKLITPTGSPAANALIRFSAISSTDNAAGEIIPGASSMSFTSADGSYDIDLQFGHYQLATLISTEDFVVHGNVWIDDTTLATDLEDLLTIISADGHITDELLKKFEGFVYRSEKAATEAESAAKTAADDATGFIQQNVNNWDAQINSQFIYKNGGLWADAPAQITDAEKLIYWIVTNGDGYAVKGSVTLPISKPANPINDDNWFVATSVNLNQLRTDSASQLSLVYDRDYFSGMIIADGAMAAKLAIWNNGQFYSVGTDTGFTSADFDADLGKGLFVSVNLTTQMQQWRDIGDLRGWGRIIDGDDVTDLINEALTECSGIYIKSATEITLYISTKHTKGVNNYGVLLKSKCKLVTDNVTLSTRDKHGIVVMIARDSNNVSCRLKMIGVALSTATVDKMLVGIGVELDSSINYRAFSNVDVGKCVMRGFNIDIDMRNVNGLSLIKNEHNGSVFCRAGQPVGGYQQHVSSCSNVTRTGNIHHSGGRDRHAFYLSTAQSGKNENVSSFGNFYYWGDTDFTYNPYMAAINCRPTDDLSIYGELINDPHGAGIALTTDSDETFYNMLIHHNTISNVTIAQPVNGEAVDELYGAGISARISVNGGYAFGTIDNNVITLAKSSDNTQMFGIITSGTDIETNDNVIKLSGTNQAGVAYQLKCTGLSSTNDKITANGLPNQHPYYIYGAAALDDCKINSVDYRGFASTVVGSDGAYTGDGLLINFADTLSIKSESGEISFNSKNKIDYQVSATTAGFIVKMDPRIFDIKNIKITATTDSASISNTRILRGGDSVQIVLMSYSGGVLNPSAIDIAVNVYIG